MSTMALVILSLIFYGVGALTGGFPGLALGVILSMALVIRVSRRATVEPTRKVTARAPRRGPPRLGGTMPFAPTTSPAAPPGQVSAPDYRAVVAETLAYCVALHREVGFNEINLAIAQIERDSAIERKDLALSAFRAWLASFLEHRARSPALFELDAAGAAHRLGTLPAGAIRTHLAVMLQAWLSSSESEPAVRAFIDRTLTVLQGQPQISKEQAVEAFIKRRGDQAALSTFRRLRRDPATFGSGLKSAARQNSVLRTALGVFTGLIAVDLVRDAMRQTELDAAVAGFDRHIEAVGGLDQLAVADEHRDVSFVAEEPAEAEATRPWGNDAGEGALAQHHEIDVMTDGATSDQDDADIADDGLESWQAEVAEAPREEDSRSSWESSSDSSGDWDA
jgi:5-carboxymethyl-2-hydroxymuconate isomerase